MRDGKLTAFSLLATFAALAIAGCGGAPGTGSGGAPETGSGGAPGTGSGGAPETGSGQVETAAAEPVLRFSAIPDQNTTETREKLAPLVEHLSEQLGVEVEYVAARDYQASVEMFKNGDVQLAWFGGLTGVQARRAVDGARALAQGESDPKFYSYFIAHRDSGVEPSEEFPAGLGELKFTFGSESSTSGRLMPEFYIRENTQQSPADFFEHPVGFSGSHDKTVELVESGQFQAGAVNYTVYDKRVAAGDTDPEVVRVIWKTPFYADYNWTVRPDVDADFGYGLTDRLQQTLVAIDDPALLAALPRQRLIPATNEEFEGIRQVAEALDMLR